MTYENDPNRRIDTGRDIQSHRMEDSNRSYVGWVVGAALVLALIVGVFAMNRGDMTNTASTNNPAASSSTTNRPASTTGSGAGTSTTPAPSTPAAPAR